MLPYFYGTSCLARSTLVAKFCACVAKLRAIVPQDHSASGQDHAPPYRTVRHFFLSQPLQLVARSISARLSVVFLPVPTFRGCVIKKCRVYDTVILAFHLTLDYLYFQAVTVHPARVSSFGLAPPARRASSAGAAVSVYGPLYGSARLCYSP